MDNTYTSNRQMFRNNILLFLFLLGWNLLPAQSISLDNLSEDIGAFQKLYFYPSVLRALGGTQSEGFSHLVEEVDLVIVFTIDSAFVNTHRSEFTDLNKNLQEEGYEEIASGYQKGVKNELFLLEKEERINGYVFYRMEQNEIYIVELVGNIHIDKLNDLMNIDIDNFLNLIK